jgi:glycosyltransferase involved in cell wall biosynthesis
MAARAVRCFTRQTYPAKRLLIVNTGEGPMAEESATVMEPCFIGADALSIGALRNLACENAAADIIVHMDDDDLSHPFRIEEQVALLQVSRAAAVGYRECLFWRTPYAPYVADPFRPATWGHDGEAWLYINPNQRHAIGASLCYWREAWRTQPFADLPKSPQGTGEDVEWLRRVTCVGVSAVESQPRMICTIHGGNSSDYSIIERSVTWRCTPEWDMRVRAIMEAA